MRRKTINLTLDPVTINILDQAAKISSASRSRIIDKLVQENIGDRKQRITAERRVLAKRMAALDVKLKDLEDTENQSEWIKKELKAHG